MKNKRNKIAAAIGCLVLASVLAIPALADTSNFSVKLPAGQKPVVATTGSKDSSVSTNVVVQVNTVNIGSAANFSVYSTINGVSARATDDFTVGAGGKSTISYLNSNWSGPCELMAWAQSWGVLDDHVDGTVAFH